MNNFEKYHYADFVYDQYRELIQLAKENYHFRLYTDFKQSERFILWRHDLDFSVHSARKIAKIEAEEGIVATYFLLLHSEFYNLFEKKITQYVKEIIALGHQIGLHFDTHYYDIQNEQEIETLLLREKNLLEETFGQEITVFSFHNTNSFTMNCKNWQYAGMINTYAEYFQSKVGYCSDSNGYWRFRRLREVLQDATDERLQILTHPAWWSDQPASPRDKVSFCIDGRARYVHEFYDQLLEQSGRLNLK